MGSSPERYARERDIPLRIFRADWRKYGKSAGYRRNAKMHEYIKMAAPSEFMRACICFWDGTLKGTAQNFALAERHGTLLKIIREG